MSDFIEVGIRDGKRAWMAPVEWHPRPDGLEWSLTFQPGYSSNPDAPPARNYGVHGMELHWQLRGPKGGSSFLMYTDWIPGTILRGHGISPDGRCSHVHQSYDGSGRWEQTYPMGADLGYHAKSPQWEDQSAMRDDCDLAGGRCYYDGTSLGAGALAKEFVVHGEPAIWAKLEDWYRNITQAVDG